MNPLFDHSYVISMQYVFLLGLLISTVTIFFLKRNESTYLLAALPIFALTFHQVDEYLISPYLFGEEYHFLNWAYRSGVDVTPLAVVTINLVGYLIATLPFLFNQSSKAFSLMHLFVAGSLIANGMFHLGGSTIQSDYSPGMATALFLFLPLYIKSVLLAAERNVSFKLIFALSLYGFIGHFVMIWILNAI